MRILLLALLVPIFGACASGQLKQKAIMLNNGDSRDKVLQTMGTPIDRQMHGDLEALSYCEMGLNMNSITTVFLSANRVYSIKNYERINLTGCSGSVPMMKWEEPPNATIEVRGR